MTGLLQRDHEIGRIAAGLEAAASGAGRTLLVIGEPGIGKSALLQAASGMAEASGFLVVHARGAATERGFAYGVARQLLEPVAGIGGPLAATGQADAFGVRHALFWKLADLTEARPVLCIIDDAHWADEPSLLWAQHVARRLAGLPLTLLLGWRLGEPGSPEAVRAELARVPETETLAPTALGTAAVAALIGRELGEAADPAFVDACRQTTSGNPYFVLELVRAAAARGLAPAADAASELRGVGTVGIAALVLERIDRCSADARSLAEVVAVLDVDAGLGIAAGLADLDVSRAEAAADELERAGVLGSERPLRFTHPIARAALHDALPRGRRSDLHRSAARRLEDPGRSAAHLLLCDPAGEDWVSERLLEAARAASAAGAPGAARPLLERALAEPPGALRGPVLLELARSGRMLGDLSGAAHLAEALELADSPADRLGVVLEQAAGASFSSRPEDAVGVLEAEAGRLAPGDPARRVMEAHAVAVAETHDRLASHAGERLAELLPAAADDLAHGALLATAAAHGVLCGHATGPEVAARARAALTGGRLTVDAARDTLLYGWAARGLMWTDLGDEVAGTVDRALSDARARGWRLGVATALGWRAWLAWWSGGLADAAADADGGLAVGGLDHFPYARWFLLAAQVTVACDQGRIEEAERALAQYGIDAAPIEPTSTGQLLRLARCRLRLAGAQLDAAQADAEAITEAAQTRGGWTPGLRPVVAATHWATDARAAAEELATDEIADCRRFGVPSHIGVALRTLGEMRADQTLLDEAVETLAESPRRVELARALVAQGAALRRSRQRAASREPLRRALDIAARCGAHAVADQAEDELRASGGKPRRRELSGAAALTPSELRVARLAAEGLTNRGVAQQLFVTVPTVERHLTSVYRKLDLTGREGLAEALN